jgi:hypothetical protein
MLGDEQRLEIISLRRLRPLDNLLTHLRRRQIRRVTAKLKSESHS